MIDGLNSLFSKLDKLNVNAKETLEKSVKRNMKETVQAEAKLLCPDDIGDLRDSIKVKAEVRDRQITGIVYTNSDHAAYVEFGTGPNGEAHHDGISPDVNISYKQEGWIIPADAMSKEKAEEYGFKIIKDRGGNVIGYGTKGQYAQPFLYPALKNNKDKVINGIKEDINSTIKKVAKGD
ncbi:hypothetical protein LF65_02281 [Clostridium beijerinckii]|uniref:HK97 gp10 family phage protein n=1 Tax=Clostridium beijerinckii TaxID=1520 RepID=A0A0B5QLJ7_CLOBE|nr:HK97-gp10 family putative phage morphogenesis protein [Clostridium beijerinckii]AJG98867.1 hypothetical protein LF65_02281 [Clostridium beijerinckii]